MICCMILWSFFATVAMTVHVLNGPSLKTPLLIHMLIPGLAPLKLIRFSTVKHKVNVKHMKRTTKAMSLINCKCNT